MLEPRHTWHRLGGYRVTFTRESDHGQPHRIQVELELRATERDAHEFFTGWFASDANQCLEVGDERNCFGYPIDLTSASGVEERAVGRSAAFRVGRIIGDVSISTTLDAGQEPDAHLDEIATGVAGLLVERIEAGL